MTDLRHRRLIMSPTNRGLAVGDEDLEAATTAIPLSSSYPMPSAARRLLHPKLTSYFSLTGPAIESCNVPDGPSTFNAPSWSLTEPNPGPDAERLLESVMCRLMEAPYLSLDQSYNGTLLRIFEGYRNTISERGRLQARLEQEIEGRYADQLSMHHVEKRWEDERRSYKAEVERGVAEIAAIRQESILRRRWQTDNSDEGKYEHGDHKETVLEFLDQTTRYEDKAWSSQRATMRLRPASPSMKMRALSKKLMKKTSMTSIHADLDMPFGSPPPDIPNLPTAAGHDPGPARAHVEGHHKTGVRSSSAESASTFSCDGDLLPDEIGSQGVPMEGGEDDDLNELRRMAGVLARRRGVDAEKLLPKLMELFNEQPPNVTIGNNDQDAKPTPPPSTHPAGGLTTHTTRKHPHLMAKAQGLFHRLRPQLALESSLQNRRFSFEVGDDANIIGKTSTGFAKAAMRNMMLRKSMSLSTLSQDARNISIERSLSPIQHSQETSRSGSESRRASKIPSPTYIASSLARPRQEREGSLSSITTALQQHGNTPDRSVSMTSSVYSPPSVRQTSTTDLQVRQEPGSHRPDGDHSERVPPHSSITDQRNHQAACAAMHGSPRARKGKGAGSDLILGNVNRGGNLRVSTQAGNTGDISINTNVHGSDEKDENARPTIRSNRPVDDRTLASMQQDGNSNYQSKPCLESHERHDMS